MSVLAVIPQAGARDYQAAPTVVNYPELEALDSSAVVVAWADGDIARFLARRARLLLWGWSEGDAEALAERLVMRDREGDDDRVSCADCTHYRPGRCSNHRHAGLNASDVGRDLATLMQRCPGFKAREV